MKIVIRLFEILLLLSCAALIVYNLSGQTSHYSTTLWLVLAIFILIQLILGGTQNSMLAFLWMGKSSRVRGDGFLFKMSSIFLPILVLLSIVVISSYFAIALGVRIYDSYFSTPDRGFAQPSIDDPRDPFFIP